jgi:hypothetical protein
MNAGLGVGGLVSSLLVHLGDPSSFQRLYLLDAASYLAYIAVVLSLPRGTGALARRAPTSDEGPAPAGGRCSATARCCGSCSPPWWW